jgi:hypothetical protein
MIGTPARIPHDPTTLTKECRSLSHGVSVCILWFLWTQGIVPVQSLPIRLTGKTVQYSTVQYSTADLHTLHHPTWMVLDRTQSNSLTTQVTWAQIRLSVGYILAHFKPYNYNIIFNFFSAGEIYVAYPWYNTALKMATKRGQNMQEILTYIINSRMLCANAGFILILITYVAFFDLHFAIYQRWRWHCVTLVPWRWPNGTAETCRSNLNIWNSAIRWKQIHWSMFIMRRMYNTRIKFTCMSWSNFVWICRLQ